jgi:glycine/D-amino acid oxidase-like deaminating enzyme
VQVEEAPGEEEVRAELADRLVHAMKVVSQEVGEAIMTKMQACHLPISVDGEPLIGRHPKVSGAYIATGHGCWGILNAPATGPHVSSSRSSAAPG